MDGGKVRSVIRSLRRAVSPCAAGLTDADLLRRWAVHRDEAAFEALLWRHAAAVLGVCRRVLHDGHEAEDATQAAFLALARKAGAIGRRQAVASWLYTVAYRAALQARARRGRAAACDPHDLEVLPARPDEDPAWRDLRPVLDEEVSRLPERYRAAFVLCHVEGRTNEEAARELGCPVGTVLSRLARARQRLRDRLTRRGVTLTAGALAAALAGEAAAAPGTLVRAAVRAAALAAAGKSLAGAVSPEAAALVEGVVRAMLLTKVKAAAAVVLGVALLGGGGGMLTYRTVAGEPGAAPQESAPPAQDRRAAPQGEEKLRALLEQKETEIRRLRDRMAALEEQLKEQTRQLEYANLLKQAQAERAHQAELEARRQAEAERDLRARAEEQVRWVRKPLSGTDPREGAEDPNRGPSAGGGQAAQVEQARDEVELLEAQLTIKRAQLNAASQSLAVTERTVRSSDTREPKWELEFVALRGQREVKAAEVREAEVRLGQAKRRLGRLTEKAGPSQDPYRQQLGSRAAELEQRLDALRKELEGLRKELEQKRPGQH
jgi:RNA polymerase sigma factor (sigma-70 family)